MLPNIDHANNVVFRFSLSRERQGSKVFFEIRQGDFNFFFKRRAGQQTKYIYEVVTVDEP
jgi:hypothetical protein